MPRWCWSPRTASTASTTTTRAPTRNAAKLEKVTYQEALVQGLKVVDSTAFSLCMDNGMPMVVFGMEPRGNVTKAIRGDRIGTLVSN